MGLGAQRQPVAESMLATLIPGSQTDVKPRSRAQPGAHFSKAPEEALAKRPKKR